jgi:hypothetical protein
MATVREQQVGLESLTRRHDADGSLRSRCQVEGFTVPVRILDLRECWGRRDALVSPVNGTGEQWVSCDRLRDPGDR